MKVDERDAGSSLEMEIGNILEIVLKGNPSTGYMWQVASDDNPILRQIGETVFTPERQARGSGGTIIMRFEAVTEGTTPLKLIHHRSFEKDMPPIKTFEITVSVK